MSLTWSEAVGCCLLARSIRQSSGRARWLHVERGVFHALARSRLNLLRARRQSKRGGVGRHWGSLKTEGVKHRYPSHQVDDWDPNQLHNDAPRPNAAAPSSSSWFGTPKGKAELRARSTRPGSEGLQPGAFQWYNLGAWWQLFHSRERQSSHLVTFWP